MVNIDRNREESDIVKHLRETAKECAEGLVIESIHVAWILGQAADEIEKLRSKVVY